MEHFRNPRNMGEMKDADAIGEVGKVFKKKPLKPDMWRFNVHLHKSGRGKWSRDHW
jgi:NifU-like protein involved in Fe-S cluster formation